VTTPDIGPEALARLVGDIRACRVCAQHLPHEPRPVVRVHPAARILIAGQAPGRRVHESGLPWDDPSGDRLRDWMGLDRATFYREDLVAVAAMGFCYPGTVKGADLPPRPECAPLWRARLLAQLTGVRLTLVIGGYAQRWHMRERRSTTAVVADFANFAPGVIPLPHPSWRNNGWLRRNPWFEADLVPSLRAAVAAATP
jgi:uracil-DNA glycosylase